MNIILMFVLQILLFSSSIQGMVFPDTVWGYHFNTAEEIRMAYREGRKACRGNNAASLYNDYYMVWNSGEYILRHKGKAADADLLLKIFPRLSLNASTLTSFMSKNEYSRLVDHYYLLQALKAGETFDAARDAVTVDMRFLTLGRLNRNDYWKLRDVFSSRNTSLHMTYLAKLPFLFQNHGCTEGLLDLRAIIEKHVADSPLKEEIMMLYKQYIPLMRDKPAPVFTLKDAQGAEHSLVNFKGKLLVIDVWATWCCSCLKKIPLFLQLADKYRYRNDVAFITISIDRSKVRPKWLKALQEHGMTGLLNLIPDMDHVSPFEEAYHCSSVPRYIIIDGKGNIVTAFAPSPGDGLEVLVESILNQ